MCTSLILRWFLALGAVLLLVSAGAALADEPPKPAAPQPAPAQPAPKPAATQPAPQAEPELPPRPYEFLDEGLIETAKGTVVYFYRTNFVTPKDLLESLTKLLEVPDVTMKTFDRQNILLIEGAPEAVEIALEAAAYFDVSVPQVFIEAKVIEITYDSNFEFGLDYLWTRNPGGGYAGGPNTLFRGADSVLNPTSFIASQLPGGLPFQGTSLLFGFLGPQAEEYGLLDVTLQALQLDGKAEVLSKPSIICTQGLEASVTTTEDRQIVTFQNADKNNQRYQGSSLRTGVTLKVKAQHIGDNFVTLEIEPTVNGVQGASVSGGATLRPVITTRSAKTTVTMADGETLVIGGLYTNARVHSKAKTPLFSDIPLLGQLFTRTQEAKAKSELVFMLTPTIVRKSTADLKIIVPPSELERLDEGEDCWRPAGPSLGFPDECKPKPSTPAPTPSTTSRCPPPPPPPPPSPCAPCRSDELPPPVTSTPSSLPRHRR